MCRALEAPWWAGQVRLQSSGHLQLGREDSTRQPPCSRTCALKGGQEGLGIRGWTLATPPRWGKVFSGRENRKWEKLETRQVEIGWTSPRPSLVSDFLLLTFLLQLLKIWYLSLAHSTNIEWQSRVRSNSRGRDETSEWDRNSSLLSHSWQFHPRPWDQAWIWSLIGQYAASKHYTCM